MTKMPSFTLTSILLDEIAFNTVGYQGVQK